MSNFNCEQCGKPIIDSENGYVNGCEHYAIERGVKKMGFQKTGKSDVIKSYDYEEIIVKPAQRLADELIKLDKEDDEKKD